MIAPEHLPADPELRALYLAVDLQHAAEALQRTTICRYLLRKAAEERIDAWPTCWTWTLPTPTRCVS